MMKKALIAVIALAFSAGSALAADTAKKPTAQQERMKSCNKEAGDKGLKKDERKAFMKSCLSGKPAEAAEAAAPNADCQAKATEKKLAGAAKSSFMKKCEADAKGAN